MTSKKNKKMEYLRSMTGRIESAGKKTALYGIAGTVTAFSGIYAAIDEDFRIELVDRLEVGAMNGRRSRLLEMGLWFLPVSERRTALQRIETAYADYQRKEY